MKQDVGEYKYTQEFPRTGGISRLITGQSGIQNVESGPADKRQRSR